VYFQSEQKRSVLVVRHILRVVFTIRKKDNNTYFYVVNNDLFKLDFAILRCCFM